ncbi:hypothetical protein, partial [Pseudomonas fragi]|uniref:hypothetical protein n=1 Tax=Pseudomonas fragi TaxID=296 RepID=UPI001CA39537
TEKWADKLAKAARTGYFAINSAKFSGIFNLLRGCGKLIGASLDQLGHTLDCSARSVAKSLCHTVNPHSPTAKSLSYSAR